MLKKWVLTFRFGVCCDLFVFFNPRNGFSDRRTFRASTDWEPVRGSGICLAWFCAYLFLGLGVWFLWGFFYFLASNWVFPPSVPHPQLKGTAVPVMMPDSGRCPLQEPVPKTHFLNERFPSPCAEEVLPGSSSQLCFAGENDGLRMRRLLAGDPKRSQLIVSLLPLRMGSPEFIR